MTDVDLKEHLTALIDAAEKRADAHFESMKEMVQEAFSQSQRALDKAEAATEKRLEGMNEFRESLRDQATQFVTRETLDALTSKLEIEIDHTRKDLDALATRLDLSQGHETGSRMTWANMAALVAGAGTVIAIIVVAANYLSTH